MTFESVAVIGNCYFDEIYTIEDYPEPDDKILASDLEIVLGGSATNTSSGLVALGISTHLFTVLGNDEDAYHLFKQMRQKGINASYVNHIDGKSGRTIILLDKNKASTKIGYQGVCSDLSQHVLFDGLSNPVIKHVHLASVNLKTIKKALTLKGNKTYSLDFGAKTLESPKEELIEILNKLDFVFFNEDIFNDFYNHSVDDLETISLPFDVIITAGKNGIYGKINNKIHHIPIIPVDVTDTTGAGDAVAAAVIYGFLNKLEESEILKFAVKAASIKIQTFGASNGHATIQQMREFYDV